MNEFIQFLYFSCFFTLVLQLIWRHLFQIRAVIKKCMDWQPTPILSANEKERLKAIEAKPIVYDYRPLQEKVDEYIRLKRATDRNQRAEFTAERLDRKVWDQKFEQFLHQDDPDKKHRIDRAPTQCDPAHSVNEVCRQCDDMELIKNWQGTTVYRRKNG